MAIVTLKGHVSRAINFVNQDNVYIAIGRTTAWDDETNPPVPGVEDAIEEVVAVKKVETKTLVVLDDETGTIQYMEHKYRPCTPEEALELGARWVYCYCCLEYDEVPVGISYRQVALQTGIIKNESVTDERYVLLPEDIDDIGVTEILDNVQPIYRRVDKKEKLGIIAEF